MPPKTDAKRKRAEKATSQMLLDLVKLMKQTGRYQFTQDEVLQKKKWNAFRSKFIEAYGINLIRELLRSYFFLHLHF